MSKTIPESWISVRQIERETGVAYQFLVGLQNKSKYNMRYDAAYWLWVSPTEAVKLRAFGVELKEQKERHRSKASKLRARIDAIRARFSFGRKKVVAETKEQPKKHVKPKRDWNKKKYSKFCELETGLPNGASKVVLIYRGEDRQELRIFSDDIYHSREAFKILANEESHETPVRVRGKYDFVIDRKAYDIIFDGIEL